MYIIYRTILVTMVSIAMLFSLVACSKVVEDTKAKPLINQAEEVVSQLIAADYEALMVKFDERMKQELTEDKLLQVQPTIEAAGSFVRIKNSVVQKKDDYYVTVVVVECKQDDLIFTVSFNANNEIIGLYVK